MKTLVTGLAVVSAALLLVGPASGQIGAKKKGDARVHALLEEADLKFEVDKDGDFRLINQISDDRSQIFFVNSATEELGDMEIREVWSVGYITERDELPVDVLVNLMAANAQVKLGGWQSGRMNGQAVGIFRAQIAADTDVETLLTTMRAVSGTADEKEQELLGSDDL